MSRLARVYLKIGTCPRPMDGKAPIGQNAAILCLKTFHSEKNDLGRKSEDVLLRNERL
jgi:hypothetical protein